MRHISLENDGSSDFARPVQRRNKTIPANHQGFSFLLEKIVFFFFVTTYYNFTLKWMIAHEF